MFCLACWANLPDGTARCPRCGADPRVRPAGAAAPEASDPATRRPVADQGQPARRRFTLARLNLALAAVLVTAVATPLVARWYGARQEVEAPPGATPLPVAGRPVPRETPDLPRPATPEPNTAAVPSAGPEVALGQEAVRLYREGRVAEACERFREAAVRAPGEVTRANAARPSRPPPHANTRKRMIAGPYASVAILISNRTPNAAPDKRSGPRGIGAPPAAKLRSRAASAPRTHSVTKNPSVV